MCEQEMTPQELRAELTKLRTELVKAKADTIQTILTELKRKKWRSMSGNYNYAVRNVREYLQGLMEME